MIKNPDLMILILKDIQNNYSMGGYFSDKIIIDKFSKEEISYNLQLLHDENFVLYKDTTVHGLSCKRFLIERLTIQGEEFLELSKNSGAWKKAKDVLIPTGTFILEMARDIMVAHISSLLSIGK